MDRLIEGAAFAAVVASLTLGLSACGGGSGTQAGAAAPTGAGAGASAQSIDGITTPTSVSVVTAKNAN